MKNKRKSDETKSIHVGRSESAKFSYTQDFFVFAGIDLLVKRETLTDMTECDSYCRCEELIVKWR